MTTDHDLLARIKEIDESLSEECDCDRESNWVCRICRYADPLIKALRAVVEIHAPRDYKPGFRDVKGTLHYVVCGGCSDRAYEPVKFPCFEFSAVEKELG